MPDSGSTKHVILEKNQCTPSGVVNHEKGWCCLHCYYHPLSFDEHQCGYCAIKAGNQDSVHGELGLLGQRPCLLVLVRKNYISGAGKEM
jgi:hypothetical protein